MARRLLRDAELVEATLHLRIGYFDNFKGANTVLVCGDEESLHWLADLLRNLEDANAEPVGLHLLQSARVRGGVELVVYPVGRDLGVRRIGSAPRFAWHQSAEGWLESAEKIEVVARGSAGHCYLGGTPAGGAVVMVSKDEYDKAWWGRQG